jgi:hypothetical protein
MEFWAGASKVDPLVVNLLTWSFRDFGLRVKNKKKIFVCDFLAE